MLLLIIILSHPHAAVAVNLGHLADTWPLKAMLHDGGGRPRGLDVGAEADRGGCRAGHDTSPASACCKQTYILKYKYATKPTSQK